MKITSLLQNNVATFAASGVLLIVFYILGMNVNTKISIHNPFLVLTLFFMVQAIVAMFVLYVDDFDGRYSEENAVLASRILSPIKTVTAGVMLTLADIGELPAIYKMLLSAFLVWLITSGITGIIMHYFSPLRKKLIQNKKVAQTTKLEKSLVEDLSTYFLNVDISEPDSKS